MDATTTRCQPLSGKGGGALWFGSGLEGFVQQGAPIPSKERRNMGTKAEPRYRDVDILTFRGTIVPDTTCCPECGGALHGNGMAPCTLLHIPIGGTLSRLSIGRQRMRCPECGWCRADPIPFRAEGHMCTEELARYAEDLLAYGFTLKETAHVTGLCRNAVKDIDRKRLERLWLEDGPKDGQRRLKLPDRPPKRIGIDESRLHDGHRHATIIADLETGHVLWAAHGRKKQVVYDFVERAGMEWMAGVEAVASDMNSDYQEAFLELCPHLDIVYDHFHIVKNFNEKVISEVRKDIQRELVRKGGKEAARKLKHTKYLLMSSAGTRARWEREAEEGRPAERGAELFGKPERLRKPGAQSRYEELMEGNELLLACDLVKEKLRDACTLSSTEEMACAIRDTIGICRETRDSHFAWFAKLLESHFGGIVAHARHRISTGRVEGTNNLIKTLRRKGYGYPDDDYFFLKIVDASYRKDRY